MPRARTVLIAAATVLAAGAISWGVYAESREARAQAILSAIETAEEKIPYTGLRRLVGPETVELRLWSREGEKRVEFTGVAKASRLPALPRVPFAGGFPAFLKPGQYAWKKRIKDCDLAVKNYDVRIAGRDVVAGRACEVVEVSPRHRGRASYRVAADLENRFPLRFEVLVGGERLFEARFKEIEYHPDFPPKTFQGPKPPPAHKGLTVTPEAVPLEALPSRAGFPVWLPAWTPPGFRPLASELVRVKLDLPEPAREALRRFLSLGAPKLDQAVAHVDYTDGIAMISIVECAADSDLWAIARKFMPGYRPQRQVDGKATAVRISDRLGAAYIVELGGTVALVAGTVAAEDLETMIRTFERR